MPGFHLFGKQVFERGGHFSYPTSSSSSSSSDEKTPQNTRVTNYGPQRRSSIQYFRVQSAVKDGPLDDTQRRSSPKRSTYEPSLTQSGRTLVDPPFAASGTDPEPAHVLVGEDDVTVTTRQIDDDDDNEEQGSEDGSMSPSRGGMRRSNTAPSILHGSTTSLEGPLPGPRALSHPQVDWAKLNVYRRLRTHADRKDARKGKAHEPAYSSHSSKHPTSTTPSPTTKSPAPSTPQHGSCRRPSTSTNISPRASVGEPHRPQPSTSILPTTDDKPSTEHIERKDSHFPDAIFAKEKSAAELQAILSRQLSSTPNTSHRKRSSFFKHPIQWLRNRSPSTTSTSSSSGPEYVEQQPQTRLPCSHWSSHSSPRHEQEEEEDKEGRKEKEEEGGGGGGGEVESEPFLPPGFSAPEYGIAGPVGWIDQCWKDHHNTLLLERRKEERRVRRRRQEEEQRAKEGGMAMRYKSSGEERSSGELSMKAWCNDGGKGSGEARRGRGGEREDLGREALRMRGLQRMRQNGVCVSTVTLGECKF